MKTLLYIAVALFMGFLVCPVFGQPPQPGDTPAPTVKDSLQVAEHNELTAKIVGPLKARAGSIIAFDVSGSSDEGQELQFRPHVPDDAIVFDTAWKFDPEAPVLVYASVAKPGHYKVVWSVENGHAADVMFLNIEVHGGEPPPDPGDDPPDPPPGDVALLKFVEALAAAVEASNHDTVAETFRGLALRIELKQLVEPQDIYNATKTAIFGPQIAKNPEWKPFFNALMPYLLDVKRIAKDEWQDAYEVVARGVAK